MDKSAGNKKSPVGTTSRAYSIFGGIINLAHQHHTPKSNVLSASSSPKSTIQGNVAVGTSQDPQGSSTREVYTVNVTNSENPDITNQVKTYENLVSVKKPKGDQSKSTVSSLSLSASGMNTSGSGGGGSAAPDGSTNNGSNNASASGGGKSRIGPAPRTLSILTALNELAIEPNPPCSSATPSTTGNNRNSSGSNTSSTIISKSNPSHSSYHYPQKLGGIQQQSHHAHNIHANKTGAHERSNTANILMASSPSASTALHHQQYTPPKNGAPGASAINTSTVYHSSNSTGIYSTRGLYSNCKSDGSRIAAPNNNANNARLTKGYNEQRHHLGALPPPPPYGNVSAGNFPSNSLPLVVARQTGNKSQGSHKASSMRRGSAGKQQRDRSKSRTPDWIWKIFQLTKNGKLEELQQSLLGLDPTLIRHLADAKGNTVLHCAVRGGHVNTLQWLVSVLGSQCTEAALNDNNQAGRTVILTALKKGQLECLQWLVHNTECGEKALLPNEGERSLLHHAATHGDLNAVRWLSSELIDKGISVDIRDAGGMTPLHDAAKSGHISVCHELILAGADPLSQTELGWRPSDLAIRHRHKECASYFMVAEAAGSLGNQLHSLLLAFNHLRQEHEELRSHFRETLRVGKWLAKERNDLIKHFPSKWTQEAGVSAAVASGSNTSTTSSAVSSPPSSLLLGGANNGARFSDMEHKIVVAEQAWRKLSQNSDDTCCEWVLNGDESSPSTTVNSHEVLPQRLAAIQLRHTRNQSLGNSLLSSGSSDEDPYQDINSSSSDASSSDGDAEHITSDTAGSGGGGTEGAAMMMRLGPNAPAIIHSSTVSHLQKNSGVGTMRTRASTATATPTTNKAAPWLLPPNDAFLSQLSPFVGAHIGKGLPALDLLHGAPTSSSLMSPVTTPSSPSSKGAAASSSKHQPTSVAAAPATAADSGWKNEKSLVQMDTERHGGNHAGKQDPTSLDISVLEVIEPTSHASPASSSFKKDFQQAPDLICGMQYKKRHGGKQRISQQQSLSLRERRPRKAYYYSHSEENLLGHHYTEADGLYEPVSPYLRDEFFQQPISLVTSHHPRKCSEGRLRNVGLKNDDDTITTCKGESSGSQTCRGGNEQLLSRPSSSLSIPISVAAAVRRKKAAAAASAAAGDTEQQQSQMLADASRERSCDNEICCSGTSKVNSSLPSTRSVVVAPGESDNKANNAGTRNITSKNRTPSPKSYVTKLTVIPVEATTETCFLSVRSTLPSSSFQEQDQHKQPHNQQQESTTGVEAGAVVEVHHHDHDNEELEESHQLHLPGDNTDELSCSLAFSCQVPNYSVSSSNTPVMPRFNSSGTVVFPLRKPSSDWHSTELLSLTTPDSSLVGRLSPNPSETSRTESALAPPLSYVSHASQNSEVSKTESARGHHYHHHTMNEVSAEERDLESPVGSDGPLHLHSSFINHPASSSTSTSFQSAHPLPLSPEAAASPTTETNATSQLVSKSTTSLNSNNNINNDNNVRKMLGKSNVLRAESKINSGLVDSLVMCKSNRKESRDFTTSTITKDYKSDEDGKVYGDDGSSTVTTSAFSPTCTHNNVADNDEKGGDGDHHGDNDRFSVKHQRGLFEKQQQSISASAPATTSTTRSIRSHLSTNSSSIHKVRALQLQHRLPKGHHHHFRGQSKPWYEIEGSDDEGSLLQVAKSRSSHSSNFSSSINPTNLTSSSSNSPGSSTPVTSNPEESSSQNESAAEENQNNSGTGSSSSGTEAEQKDEEEDGVQKVE